VARWENEIDGKTVQRNLAINSRVASVAAPVPEVSTE
jgi:hypothetical protein